MRQSCEEVHCLASHLYRKRRPPKRQSTNLCNGPHNFPILGKKDIVECLLPYRGKIGPFFQSYERYDANFQMDFFSWGI
jgi:hypothetical protein